MMKRITLYITLFFTVLLAGCSRQSFPGCCEQDTDDITRSVPFLETFLFNFKTGSGPITTANPDGNLNVISQAVLLTLLSSAQEDVLPGTGVITGTFMSNGVPVKDVALKVTDAAGKLLAIRAEGRFVGSDLVLADGMKCPVDDEGVTTIDIICIKGSLFYNSLGGVPDFSNSRGTSAAGSFTVFNLPPGDAYLWTFRGGRGNARLTVFDERVSVGKVQVVPIPISTVLVEGVALEAKDQTTLISDASIAILGTKEADLTVTSNSIGQYTINPVGASGRHFMKATKSGYWTTYHVLDTIPFQSTVEVPGVTRNVTLYNNSFVNEIAAPKGIPANTSLGIITGRVQFGNGTSQHCAKISVTDAAGNDLSSSGAVIVYSPPTISNGVDTLRAACEVPSDPDQTGTDGFYFIYNLPSGEIFLKYDVVISTGTPGNEDIVSGGIILTAFPGVVFVQGLSNTGEGISQDLSGLITKEDLSLAADTQITVLGIKDRSYSSASLSNTTLSIRAKSDGAGDYLIEKNLDDTDNYPLVGGTSYRFKTSKAGMPDTYQLITMTNTATKKDLLSVTAIVPGSGKGKIYGNLINQLTGRLATNVQLEISDLSGNLLERITSSDGVFQTIDLLPGLVNLAIVSGEDSGNMITRIYPNGVSFVEFSMAKVIPAQVKVFGGVRDLDGTLVPQAALSATGRIPGLVAPLTTDTAGNYSGELESNGHVLVKAQKSGFYDTHNFFPRSGLVDSLSSQDLYAISRAQIGALATSVGVTLDSSKGIMVGKTIENSFSSKVTTAGCTGGGPYKSALGFFNQDTVLDIAIINCTSTNSVSVFFGNSSGDGAFSLNQSYTVGTNPTDIVSGDFDGNGIADLVVSNFVSVNGAGDVISFSVLLGDKKGGFTSVDPPVADVDNKGNTLTDPTTLVTGLFDSDSFLDIAVAYQGVNVVLVYVGKGDGTFAPKLNSSNNVDTHPVGVRPTALVVGDFNKDNRFDLAVVNRDSDNVSILLGNTEGGFPDTNTPVVGDGPESLVTLDINTDGQLDLAVVNRIAGTITILTSDISGTFSRLIDTNNNVVADIVIGGSPSAITWGDFNGDNRIDLAISNKGTNNVTVFFGDGDGQFSKSSTETLTISGPDDILTVDIDQNNLHDLIVVGPNIETLLGTEKAVSGISVEARDLLGVVDGTVLYPGSGGSSTSVDGSFVILNVIPGLTLVRASSGGAGNSIINTVADAVSYTKIKTVTVLPHQVSVSGKAFDPVGPAPGVPVGNVNVDVLGMGQKITTDAQGSYLFNLDANSEYVFKLFFDVP